MTQHALKHYQSEATEAWSTDGKLFSHSTRERATSPLKSQTFRDSKHSRPQHVSQSRAREIFESSLRNAPKPQEPYLVQARSEPLFLSKPQSLLLVLDLNGTLLDRKRKTTICRLRPHLKDFVKYCLDQHSVVVWSSAKPENVAFMCSKVFTLEQRRKVLMEWGRERLGLSELEYWSKVQCYKRLENIWDDESLRKLHPESINGGRWDQSNTILIDDSALKASAQPYSHIEIPEFKSDSGVDEEKAKILVHVIQFLEEVRRWDDVSRFMRKTKSAAGLPFAVPGACEDLAQLKI